MMKQLIAIFFITQYQSSIYPKIDFCYSSQQIKEENVLLYDLLNEKNSQTHVSLKQSHDFTKWRTQNESKNIIVIEYNHFSDAIHQNWMVMRKMDEKLKEKYQILPYSQFQTCVQDDNIIKGVFENVADSIQSSKLFQIFKTVQLKNRIDIVSEVFDVLDFLSSEKRVIYFKEKMINLEVLNGNPVGFNLDISDNVFIQGVERSEPGQFFDDPSSVQLTPSGNVYSWFLYWMTIESSQDFEQWENIQQTFHNVNNEKEQYQANIKLIQELEKLPQYTKNFKIERPSFFKRIVNWVLSWFSEDKCYLVYDFEDLIMTVLQFDHKNRPNAQEVKNKLYELLEETQTHGLNRENIVLNKFIEDSKISNSQQSEVQTINQIDQGSNKEYKDANENEKYSQKIEDDNLQEKTRKTDQLKLESTIDHEILIV